MVGLGQRMDKIDQENSANTCAKWPIFTRENQGGLLRKSWDFESKFGSLFLSPHGRILSPINPIFLAHELRKR